MLNISSISQDLYKQNLAGFLIGCYMQFLLTIAKVVYNLH